MTKILVLERQLLYLLPRGFAYEVTAPPNIPISRWQYDIEPTADGCTVTETNWLRVPLWFFPLAILISGVSDRAGANNANMASTLARLKAHLETAQEIPTE